jgi:hypothetical protein
MADEWQAIRQDFEKANRKKGLPTAEEAFGPETPRKQTAEEFLDSPLETQRKQTAEEFLGPEPPQYPVYGTPPGTEGRPSPTPRQIIDATFGQFLPFITQRQPGQPLYGTPTTPTKESVSPPGSAYQGTPKEGYKPPIATAKERATYAKLPESYLAQELPKAGILALSAPNIVRTAPRVAKEIVRGATEHLPVEIPSTPTPKIKIPPITRRGKVEAAVKAIGGRLEPSLAGESAGEQLEIGSKEAKNVAEQMFETAKSATKDVSFIGEDYKGVDKAIDEIKGSGDYKLLTGQQKRDVNNAIRYAKEQTKRSINLSRGRWTEEQAEDFAKQVESQFGVPSPPETSFETSEGLRRDLATKAYNEARSPVGRLIKKLHNAVEDAQETAVKRQLGADSEAFQNWKNARNFYSKNVFGEGEEAKLLSRFQKMSAEKRVDLLRTGSLKDIQAIKGATGEGFQTLKQGFMDDVLTRSENNPIKAAKEIRKLLSNRAEEMEAIFDEGELGALKRIGDPGKLRVWFENHPNAKWLVKYGLAYEAIRRTLGRRFPWQLP